MHYALEHQTQLKTGNMKKILLTFALLYCSIAFADRGLVYTPSGDAPLIGEERVKVTVVFDTSKYHLDECSATKSPNGFFVVRREDNKKLMFFCGTSKKHGDVSQLKFQTRRASVRIRLGAPNINMQMRRLMLLILLFASTLYARGLEPYYPSPVDKPEPIGREVIKLTVILSTDIYYLDGCKEQGFFLAAGETLTGIRRVYTYCGPAEAETYDLIIDEGI